jgi:CspA family cold shock protein
MQRGRVKWFSAEKGFGFIEPQDGSKDVFVHRNAVTGLGWDEGLRDGEEVEYEVERTPKGLSAQNVERVESGSLL